MRIRDAVALTIKPAGSPLTLKPVIGAPLKFEAERREGFVILPGDVGHLAEVAGRLNSDKPLSYAERRQLATIIEVVVRAGKKL